MSDLSQDKLKRRFLPMEQFQSADFRASGSRVIEVIGPTVQQEAIVYGHVDSLADLPRGWADVQEPGKYRLARRDDEACFGYVVGPHSWKKFLFPPLATVLTADRTESGWQLRIGGRGNAAICFSGSAGLRAGGDRGPGSHVSRRRIHRPDLQGSPRSGFYCGR